jgi:D-sedoheptulose 7-phosphate isomerase
MEQNVEKIFNGLFENYPALSVCKNDVKIVYEILVNTYKNNGKILVCGNGGSAADCEHIVGELMKGFRLSRPLENADITPFLQYDGGEIIARGLQKGLPAISLVSHTGLMTAFLNDCDPDLVFAQQVYGYMNEWDTLIALSTSGNSENVVNAVITAKAKNGKAVVVTGESGGKLSSLCDAAIKLPSADTAKIQELTLPLYHTLCAMLEEEFFGK